MKSITIAALAAVSLLSGCASIVNDTTHPVRFETYAADGTEVKAMQCKYENDYGSQTVTTPGTAQVRRSSKDLQILCSKDGVADAKGTSISRANGGMAGNILLGGGIGAIIDHNKGTAYTYPEWVRLVTARQTSFDRRDDKEGAPNIGLIPPVAAK